MSVASPPYAHQRWVYAMVVLVAMASAVAFAGGQAAQAAVAAVAILVTTALEHLLLRKVGAGTFQLVGLVWFPFGLAPAASLFSGCG